MVHLPIHDSHKCMVHVDRYSMHGASGYNIYFLFVHQKGFHEAPQQLSPSNKRKRNPKRNPKGKVEIAALGEQRPVLFTNKNRCLTPLRSPLKEDIHGYTQLILLYKVYQGLIVKGTIPRVPAFFL